MESSIRGDSGLDTNGTAGQYPWILGKGAFILPILSYALRRVPK